MTTDSHRTSNIDSCRIITLPQHGDDTDGTLSVVENGPGSPLPFDVRRIYYLYDVPTGASRGGHSHRCLQSVIFAVAGSFDVTVDDGARTRTFTLRRPYEGLLLSPGIWRTIDNFSSGAVGLVLASDEYDEGDYVRDYSEFQLITKGK